MSKIFDAYRLKSATPTDPAEQVRQAGAPELFPAPRERQRADFSQLAQRTLALQTGPGGAVIHMASTTSGEGASFVSFNLAMTLAQVYAKKVAWIDANFLSPQRTLAGPGRVTFASMLQDPGCVASLPAGTNPFLIPGGEGLKRATGLVAAANYADVLAGLSARFDFVIVDLPPVLDSPETGIMAADGSGLLLVIEQDFLKWEIIEHGVESLRNNGVHVLGTVINRRRFALPKVIYDRL